MGIADVINSVNSESMLFTVCMELISDYRSPNFARDITLGNCCSIIALWVVWLAAGQVRPLRHHIYRGAVVGVRGAAVGARGAAVGNIGMRTYIRHICAPVHLQVLRARTDLHHFTSERFHYISKTDLHHLHW